MPLSDVVNVQITESTAGLTLPGFGTPLILGGYSKSYPARVSYYSDLTTVAHDFAPGTPEYQAAEAVFDQTPRPVRIAVGRCENKPTQHWTITPAASLPSAVTKFTVTIAGVDYPFTSDASPTAGEVVSGLTPLINAASGAHGLTATGTSTLLLTAINPGSWQSVVVGDVNLLSLVQDHGDPGLAADLDAISLDNDDWYAVVNPWNSANSILAVAAWVEAKQKLFVAQTQDTPVISTAQAGATDIATVVQSRSYKRTAVVYDPDNSTFLDAAELGRCLPLDPGSETWALKTLAGPPARKFTGTHLVNLRAKNCGWYYNIAGRNVTQQGKVADAEFIDTIRFIDWLTVDIQARVFLAIANAKKIPYTDAGGTVIAAQVKASLDAGIAVGGLVAGSASVFVPKVADQNPNDRANRHMPGVTFEANLAGAIHDVVISGTVLI